MSANLLELISTLQAQNVSLPTGFLEHAQAQAQVQQKKKVLLVGTHIQQFTGYSKVTYNIVNYLSKKQDVDLYHYGFQRAKTQIPDFRPYPANVTHFDAQEMEQPQDQGFGYKRLPEIVRQVKPDVVIIYNDSLVVCRFLEELNKQLNADERRKYKMIVYLDQVYIGQRPPFLDLIRRDSSLIFAFTEGWKKVLDNQMFGDAPKPRIRVLRHAYSTDLFTGVDRTKIRAALNIPTNGFLMLNVNRNSPRKRYDILIKAFVELLVKFPTKSIFLLCVCDKGEKGGYPLFEIFLNELKKRNVGVELFATRLMISNADQSLPDSEINNLYNAADIGVTTTEGEGFGLCQLEQMGVGIPQVVPDILGLNEFCTENNSIVVPAKVSYYIPLSMGLLGGEAFAVDSHDYCLGIERYLLDSSLRERHGIEAMKTAKEYSWDKELLPLYEEIQNA
jgi:glycosyltransferase involved in cell wall biosynthesis